MCKEHLAKALINRALLLFPGRACRAGTASFQIFKPDGNIFQRKPLQLERPALRHGKGHQRRLRLFYRKAELIRKAVSVSG